MPLFRHDLVGRSAGPRSYKVCGACVGVRAVAVPRDVLSTNFVILVICGLLHNTATANYATLFIVTVTRLFPIHLRHG